MHGIYGGPRSPNLFLKTNSAAATFASHSKIHSGGSFTRETVTSRTPMNERMNERMKFLQIRKWEWVD